MNAQDPRVGDRLSFVPSAFSSLPGTDYDICRRVNAAYTLSGVVIYVNAAHRYYTVEAPCFGYVLRESFKF